MIGTIFTLIATIVLAILYLYRNRHASVNKSFILVTLLMVVFSVSMFYLEQDWRHQEYYDRFLNFAIMGCGSYFVILFFQEEDDIGMAFARCLGWLGLIISLLVVVGGRAYLKTHLDSY